MTIWLTNHFQSDGDAQDTPTETICGVNVKTLLVPNRPSDNIRSIPFYFSLFSLKFLVLFPPRTLSVKLKALGHWDSRWEVGEKAAIKVIIESWTNSILANNNPIPFLNFSSYCHKRAISQSAMAAAAAIGLDSDGFGGHRPIGNSSSLGTLAGQQSKIQPSIRLSPPSFIYSPLLLTLPTNPIPFQKGKNAMFLFGHSHKIKLIN